MIERSTIAKKLNKAENLIKNCEYDNAFQRLNDIERINSLTEDELVRLSLFKSIAFNKTGNYEKGFEFANKAYHLCKDKHNKEVIVDILTNLGYSMAWLGELEKGSHYLIECENLLKNLSQISPSIRDQKEANLYFSLSCVSFFNGNTNKGLDYAQKSLEIREKIGDKFGIAQSLYQIGVFFTFSIPNYDLALDYAKRSQEMLEKYRIGYFIALNLINLGCIHLYKGDLTNALMYHEKALALAEKHDIIMGIFNNLGCIFFQKGDLEKALEYLKKSLELEDYVKNSYILASSFGSIIEVLVHINKIEEAKQYLEQLDALNKKEDNKNTNIEYLFSKALILQSSSRIQNRAKAQEIFKEIIQGEMISSEFTIKALLNLFVLLLQELEITQDLAILKELEPISHQLLITAKSTNSFWILAETFLLQAKLALLNFNTIKARKLLNEAQEIAEKSGLYLLAGKISLEHDKLLRDLNLWNELKESNQLLSKRFQLLKINKLVNDMILRREITDLNLSEEEPIIILIITEGGNPIFSYSFSKEKVVETHLFSGFLTTIDYFIKETFSEGLDRAVFGDYSLIMKIVKPFYFAYIFKGDSYYALQKIKHLTDNIQKKEIWDSLMHTFQSGKMVRFKEIPSLDSLITELFINKTITLKES